jgi:hypothetical protein
VLARFAAAGMILVLASVAEAQPSASLCPSGQPRADRAAVFGTVRDSATSLPLQELDIVLSWTPGGGRRRQTRTQTDRYGRYSVCDVPAGERVRVEALVRAPAESAVLHPGQSARIDLTLAVASSTLIGRVVESGGTRGLAGAEVRVPGSGVRALTRSDGSFELPAIPGGTWRLEVTHLGYRPREDSIRVPHASRVALTIPLAEDVIPLEPLVVAVLSYNLGQVGFYERREQDFGTFRTRQDWEVMQPYLPSDILRTVAGVRVVQRRGQLGYGNVVVDRSNCMFRYFMNGVRVSHDFQLDDIPTDWIEALEIYKGAAQVPAQFTINPAQPRANCGVIVIWTRTAK